VFSSPELTIAYIKRQPESAGRVLSKMRPTDAAVFLQAIPTRFAVQAVANMNPRPASLVIAKMGVTSGGALLRDLDSAEASTILRQVDRTEREELLKELPRRLRRNIEMSLTFPTGTVGAHMTTAIAVLRETDKTSDALGLVKQAGRDFADLVFVVDDNRKLVGVIPAPSLLRHGTHTALSELVDTTCAAVSPHARLEAIAGMDAWHDYSCLPVVTRRGEVIGMISRKALRRAGQSKIADTDAVSPSMAESMVEALVASVVGLVDLWTSSARNSEGQGGQNGR